MLLCSKINTKGEGQNDNDEKNDAEDPPLELPCSSCMVDTLSKLYICIFRVFDDVIRLLLGGLDGSILENDRLGEILKELVEILHGTLNLLDVIVTSPDRPKDRCCGA